MTFKNKEMYRANGLTIIAGVGGAFLVFGLANIYTAIDDKITFLIIGIVGIATGFGFLVLGLSLNNKHFGRIVLSKDRIFSFQPVRNDNFSIIIDGVGSFGNSENEVGVDVVAKKMIKELISGGATIRAARFYSRNGSQNLLSD